MEFAAGLSQRLGSGISRVVRRESIKLLLILVSAMEDETRANRDIQVSVVART